MADGGEDGDDDYRKSGLTASSYHPAAAEGDCKEVGSWRTSRCQNPCLRPCLVFLQDPGEMGAAGREELDCAIKGIS